MSDRRKIGTWALLGLVVLATAIVRLRLVDVPLDRDEGEYAYFGQLILRGVPPYATAYNLKLPGIYLAYAAVLWIFGQSSAGVHLGLIVVNAADTLLVFALATRLFGGGAALAAGAVFAGLSLSPRLHGLGGYAEPFVLVPALAGTLVLLSAVESRRGTAFFGSGVLFGLAFLVKQSGGAFILLGLAYVLVRAVPHASGGFRRVVPVVALLTGAAIPFLGTCVTLAAAGVFANFWFWTVVYALHYASALSIVAGMTLFRLQAVAILTSSWVPALLAGVGVLALLWDRSVRRSRAFVVMFAAAGLAATSAGLHFRNQYFLFLVPAVALLAGMASDALARRLARRRPGLRHALALAIAVLAIGHLVWSERVILLQTPPERFARAVYGLNPFPESVEVARWVRNRSAPKDRLAVIGSEPEIYFYAQRPAATGFVYTYALMENQPYASRMQHQMIDEIESADPRFVVLVNVSSSWVVRSTSDRTVFRWWERYQQRFARVGVADIEDAGTTYVWGDRAAAYVPRSGVWLAVFERRAP